MVGAFSLLLRFGNNFSNFLWEELQDFAYQPIIADLQIEVSEEPMIPVLGAASLCYDYL